MIDELDMTFEAPGSVLPPVPQMYPGGPSVLGFLYGLIAALGPGLPSVVTVTSNDTLLTTDNVVLADATAGAFTVTLPTAVGSPGMNFIVKKIDLTANAVTVKGAGAELIDTANTQIIDRPEAVVQVISDNVQWRLI